MKCSYCGSDEVVTGILDGIAFLPKGSSPRMQPKGFYGIQANFCEVCGHIDRLQVERAASAKKAGNGVLPRL
jgi:hypothetical protein